MDDATKARSTNRVIKKSDVLTYCRNLGWTIRRLDLSLIAHDEDTVQVAILACDQRGHFVAVSAITFAGVLGIGIIDLNTGEARFASLGVQPSDRTN